MDGRSRRGNSHEPAAGNPLAFASCPAPVRSGFHLLRLAEGWYGVPYGKLLGRTREYVEIIRMILARKQPLEL